MNPPNSSPSSSTSTALAGLNIALLHPNDRQREQLSAAVTSFGAQVQSAVTWSELTGHPLALGGVWVFFDCGAETLEWVEQLRASKEQVFWGILILGQAPTNQQQPLINAGADAYLSYPFDLPTLQTQLARIASHRAPVSGFNVLPAQFATSLDRMWARFDELSYYELLELSPVASDREVQERFHQRSLLLHPDRHRGLKRSHTAVYDRVNMIYKKLLEAYRILTNPLQRSLYDAGLGGGHKRWGRHSQKLKREIEEQSEHAETHLMLAQALRARNRGLLEIACRLSERAAAAEPESEALQSTVKGYHLLIALARRDPQIAAVLDQQLQLDESRL